MPFNTALTRDLGIKVPVIQGGMQWVGYAELASAVSNAGGLGMLTALTQPSPEDLRSEIRKCRTMTDKPFGVNITFLPAIEPPDYEAYARVAIEEGVSVVETAGNSPKGIIGMLKEANIRVIHKCTAIRHARAAVRLGADYVCMDGFECAGHIGESDNTSLILLGRARQSLGAPFIAAGGFVDGYGLAAALALGAEGVTMGTRFLCTLEAPIHHSIKQTIVDAQETDTVILLRRWKNSVRLFNNTVAKEAAKIEKTSDDGKFQEIAPYVSGKRGRQVYLNGDPNFGVWSVGQAIGSIYDVPTCAELLGRAESEALDSIARLCFLMK